MTADQQKCRKAETKVWQPTCRPSRLPRVDEPNTGAREILGVAGDRRQVVLQSRGGQQATSTAGSEK